jgi:serine/threonine protein kinase
LRAIEYLNSKGIIHRDLKLKNVLVKTKEDSNSLYKLIDFGMSDMRSKIDNSPEIGTPGYLGPEIFKF